MNQDLIDGDLIRMADRVMEALDAKYLIRPIHYEGMQRREPMELPEEGLREILYNLEIHKDYNGPDSLIRVFDDRITFWNQGSLPAGITPESIFQPHDSQPRNRLIANAFYMAGFVEAWGRGYELITETFTKEGLEVPTIEEEFGGVRVIVKREIFYGIQHGGRVDPKTGRLIKAGDTKDFIDYDTKKLTERQRLIYELLPFGITKDDTKNEPITTARLARQFGKSSSTIKRDIKVIQLGLHLGPVDYVRRITGPKMKNESGDMGHRRGPDTGRSALGPFEEGPKAGEMALEATKGRSARARFSQGGREEGWTLAGKCLAGGQCTSIGWTTVVQKPGKAPTLNRGTFGAKRRRGFGGLAPQCMKCHYRKTAAVRLPFCDSVGIRTQDPQLRRLLLYPTELRNR